MVSEAYVRSSIEFGHGTEGTRSVHLHVIRPLFFGRTGWALPTMSARAEHFHALGISMPLVRALKMLAITVPLSLIHI